jgi:hypothetical protein
MSDPRDPGWAPARRLVSRLFRAGDAPRLPIVTIRAIYLAFLVLLAILVVVRFGIGSGDGDMQPGTAFTVLVALAALETSMVFATRRRPIGGTEPEDFVATYRASVILRLAYAESIALAAFVLSFLTGDPMTFYAGVALSVPAYLLAAPTGRDITRQQEQVTDAGVGVDLMAALLGYTSDD